MYGTILNISVVWDQVRTAYHASSGARVVNAALPLLTDSKLTRVLMAQVRQPFSNRNGREGQANGGRRLPVDEMGMAELRQEVAESRDTIYQLRKYQEPTKREATGLLARRLAWPGPSVHRATGTKDRSPRAGGGCQGTQASAEVARKGSSPHVADQKEIIRLG